MSPNKNISYDYNMDAREYYSNAQNLSKGNAETDWSNTYTRWWERSPLYVLFLWFFTPGIAIYIQMIVSSIGVYFMWKMNTKAGWCWNFYECWYSILFLKEAIVFALMIYIYYRINRKEQNAILHTARP